MHAHSQTHNIPINTAQKPQWLGHGIVDVLMNSTNGTCRFFSKLHMTFPWGSSEPEHLALRQANSRQFWRLVMWSLDVLWSADCWSVPPATLCWCSRKRHCCCRHGNHAAKSWQSLQALGWENTERGSGSGYVSTGWSLSVMFLRGCRFHYCYHCWKTLNPNLKPAGTDHYQTSWLEGSAVGPLHCHSCGDASYCRSAWFLTG